MHLSNLLPGGILFVVAVVTGLVLYRMRRRPRAKSRCDLSEGSNERRIVTLHGGPMLRLVAGFILLGLFLLFMLK
jgi:hypothetical protein